MTFSALLSSVSIVDLANAFQYIPYTEIVKQGNSLRSHQNEVMNVIENSLAIELEK